MKKMGFTYIETLISVFIILSVLNILYLTIRRVEKINILRVEKEIKKNEKIVKVDRYLYRVDIYFSNGKKESRYVYK